MSAPRERKWETGVEFEVCGKCHRRVRPPCLACYPRMEMEELEGSKPRWNARPMPTPEDIEVRCKEIQAGWTAEERESRAVGRSKMPVEVKRVLGLTPSEMAGQSEIW